MSAHDIALAIADRLAQQPCTHGHVALVAGHLIAFNQLRGEGARPAEAFAELDDVPVFHCRLYDGWRDDPSKLIETPLRRDPPTGWLDLFNKAIKKSECAG